MHSAVTEVRTTRQGALLPDRGEHSRAGGRVLVDEVGREDTAQHDGEQEGQDVESDVHEVNSPHGEGG